MQKINHFWVLNLPPRNGEIHWKIGHNLVAQEKNMLLAGDNGTGKSTMLKILHESLERSKLVLDGKYLKWERNVVDLFLEICHSSYDDNLWINGELYLAYWFNVNVSKEESRQKYEDTITDTPDSELNDACLKAVELLIKNVFWSGVENIIDLSFSCSQGQLETRLSNDFFNSELRYFDSTAIKKNELEADRMIDLFVRGLKTYAKKINVSEEIMFWNILFLSTWIHAGQSQGGSKWGYIKPDVQDEKSLLANDIFVFSDTEDHGELSQWEHTKKRIWELFDLVKATQTWVIAFLDEPTNGLSRKAWAEMLEQLAEPNDKLQIFAASHDRDFQSLAFSQSRAWVGYDLDEGLSSTEMYVAKQ